MTGFYLILLGIITLDLIVDQLYSIIYSLSKMLGEADYLALKSELKFGQFSVQWLSIILFYPLMKLISLKNLAVLIKIAKYGSASIFVYALYIIIQFFVSWSND